MKEVLLHLDKSISIKYPNVSTTSKNKYETSISHVQFFNGLTEIKFEKNN